MDNDSLQLPWLHVVVARGRGWREDAGGVCVWVELVQLWHRHLRCCATCACVEKGAGSLSKSTKV